MIATAKNEWVAEWWQCTREEYDEDTECKRSSELKEFWECPFLYKSRKDGEMASKRTTRPMEKGTALHSLSLENKVTWQVAQPCGAPLKTGKSAGKACGKSSASNDHSPYWCEDEGIWVCGVHKSGRKVKEVSDTLTPQEDSKVRKMAVAIRKNEQVVEWLSHRHHEKAARSIDRETGVKKKALIDILIPKPIRIVDLKSTEQYSGESIWRTFDKHGWGFSLAHYESVIQDIVAHNGHRLPLVPWSIIVAESVPPYRVTDFPIPPDVQDICREEHREVLREVAECERTGEWNQRPLELGTPQWFHFVHGAKRETSR